MNVITPETNVNGIKSHLIVDTHNFWLPLVTTELVSVYCRPYMCHFINFDFTKTSFKIAMIVS